MWYDFYYAAYAQPDYDYYVIIVTVKPGGGLPQCGWREKISP